MEFVYLQEDALNPYKFTLCSETPLTNDKALASSSSSISPFKYLTLSENGISRHVGDESENYTFKEFAAEQTLYKSLLAIPIFDQFRRWYEYMLILLHDFYIDLFCLHIIAFSVLRIFICKKNQQQKKGNHLQYGSFMLKRRNFILPNIQ